MRKVEYDPEILYVYKIYYFLSLLFLFTTASLIISWRFDWRTGGIFFFLGFFVSYGLMVRKKRFPLPEKKLTAQKMAREITQNASPLAISRFASQLYFYFYERKQAISLLENYLDTNDPLLCATLADILLREGRPKQALNILRENPYTLADPLLLSTMGHILHQTNKYNEAIKIFERSLRLTKESGFPQNGANFFTQHLLKLSYIASIHHALGDCYFVLKDYPNAKKHYHMGNFRLFDFTLWQKVKSHHSDSSNNYRKLH